MKSLIHFLSCLLFPLTMEAQNLSAGFRSGIDLWTGGSPVRYTTREQPNTTSVNKTLFVRYRTKGILTAEAGFGTHTLQLDKWMYNYPAGSECITGVTSETIGIKSKSYKTHSYSLGLQFALPFISNNKIENHIGLSRSYTIVHYNTDVTSLNTLSGEITTIDVKSRDIIGLWDINYVLKYNLHKHFYLNALLSYSFDKVYISSFNARPFYLPNRRFSVLLGIGYTF